MASPNSLKPSKLPTYGTEGLLTAAEIATALGVCRTTVHHWRKHGLLRSHIYNDKHECLFDPPTTDKPTKQQGQKLADRQRSLEFTSHRMKEVQDEA